MFVTVDLLFLKNSLWCSGWPLVSVELVPLPGAGLTGGVITCPRLDSYASIAPSRAFPAPQDQLDIPGALPKAVAEGSLTNPPSSSPGSLCTVASLECLLLAHGRIYLGPLETKQHRCHL